MKLVIIIYNAVTQHIQMLAQMYAPMNGVREWRAAVISAPRIAQAANVSDNRHGRR